MKQSTLNSSWEPQWRLWKSSPLSGPVSSAVISAVRSTHVPLKDVRIGVLPAHREAAHPAYQQARKPVAGRAVEGEGGGAVQQCPYRRAGFEAGQRGAQAVVDAVAEG